MVSRLPTYYSCPYVQKSHNKAENQDKTKLSSLHLDKVGFQHIPHFYLLAKCLSFNFCLVQGKMTAKCKSYKRKKIYLLFDHIYHAYPVQSHHYLSFYVAAFCHLYPRSDLYKAIFSKVEKSVFLLRLNPVNSLLAALQMFLSSFRVSIPDS